MDLQFNHHAHDKTVDQTQKKGIIYQIEIVRSDVKCRDDKRVEQKGAGKRKEMNEEQKQEFKYYNELFRKCQPNYLLEYFIYSGIGVNVYAGSYNGKESAFKIYKHTNEQVQNFDKEHENIVKLYDDFKIDGKTAQQIIEQDSKIDQQPINNPDQKPPFRIDQQTTICILVMELGECSLQDELNNNDIVFTFDKLLKIIFDCLDSLMIHRLYRVIHSDIKPMNILYSRGKYVFIDYDVSQKKGNTYQEIKCKGCSLRFAAPEQKTRSKVYHSTDIYCLGLVFSLIIEKYEKDLQSDNEQAHQNDNKQQKRKQIVEEFKNILQKYMINEKNNERKQVKEIHQLFFKQICEKEFQYFLIPYSLQIKNIQRTKTEMKNTDFFYEMEYRCFYSQICLWIYECIDTIVSESEIFFQRSQIVLYDQLKLDYYFQLKEVTKSIQTECNCCIDTNIQVASNFAQNIKEKYYNIEDYKSGEEHLEKAYEYLKQNNYQYDSQVYRGEVMITFCNYSYLSGEKCQIFTHEFQSKCSYYNYLLAVYSIYRAKMYLLSNQKDKSRECFKQYKEYSRKIAQEKLSYPESLQRQLQNVLGYFFYINQQFKKAEEQFLLTSQIICQDKYDEFADIEIEILLGQIQIKNRNFENAHKHFQKAFDYTKNGLENNSIIHYFTKYYRDYCVCQIKNHKQDTIKQEEGDEDPELSLDLKLSALETFQKGQKEIEDK